MIIHHYTSINILALILKYKSIRFNRLDRVDDVEEYENGSGPAKIKLGKYQFVSCWTKDSSENISLWKMYSDYSGVRISLDEDMFVTYKVNENFESFFRYPIAYEDDCFISSFMNQAKLYDIEYVDDLEEKIKSAIMTSSSKTWFNFSEIGKYKKKQWEFQKESRFKITVYPMETKLLKEDKNPFNVLTSILDAKIAGIQNNKHISRTYFDIPLKDETLSNMTVMLGPLTTDSDMIIVESLLKQYCPTAKIVKSSFWGKIRNKKD